MVKSKRGLQALIATLAVAVLALSCAAGASADGDVSWGVSGVTPSLDTANGDYLNYTVTSPQTNPRTGNNPILPAGGSGAGTSHEAEDLAVWNTGSSLTAPSGGQILEVRLTGCAVENASADAANQESQGVPVNTVLFQTLKASGDDWTSDSVSGQFLVPFCGSGGASSSTVSTYAPIHMCVTPGEALALHDIGGYIAADGAYPQGIPMEVLAPASGPSTDSFVGVGTSTYGPGLWGPNDTTTAERAASGFANEPSQELTMQVIEGTGNDAYGLCAGGFGDEPSSTSNAIDCDYRVSGDGSNTANPVKYPDHPFCAGPGDPIPGSNVAPGGSSSGSSGSSSGSSGSKGSSGSGSTSARAPAITRLRFNPSTFVAKRGSTVTYRDSEPGLTTLRFYRVVGKRDKLVKTLRHQDKLNAGIHVSGLAPGKYLVRLTSVYRHKTGKTATTRITVISRR